MDRDRRLLEMTPNLGPTISSTNLPRRLITFRLGYRSLISVQVKSYHVLVI